MPPLFGKQSLFGQQGPPPSMSNVTKNATSTAKRFQRTGTRLLKTLTTPQVKEAAESLIHAFFTYRMAVTFLLIGWGIAVSVAYTWTWNTPEIRQRRKDEVKFVNHLFLGDRPIIGVLVRLWLYSTIVALVWFSVPPDFNIREAWKNSKFSSSSIVNNPINTSTASTTTT